MNAEQRKELQQCLDVLSEVQNILNTQAEAERDKYENLSEGLQQAERGQKLEEAADALEEASGNIDDIISSIETAMEG